MKEFGKRLLSQIIAGLILSVCFKIVDNFTDDRYEKEPRRERYRRNEIDLESNEFEVK